MFPINTKQAFVITTCSLAATKQLYF